MHNRQSPRGRSGWGRVVPMIVRSKVAWAVVAELLILAVCAIIRPDFLSISVQGETGLLYGSLIDILNRSAEITIIAMGMTLVIATGGTDLSVGATMALAGAVALKLIRWDMGHGSTGGNWTMYPYFIVILAALSACTLMGAFNGLLVSRFGMQPIIATLVMMVAGRGIAQVITDGKQMTTDYAPFLFIGQGGWLFPTPVIIAAVVVALTALLTRKTAFGLFVESVGVNPSASRLSGLNARRILMVIYALTGFLAGIAGMIYASRIGQNDSNHAGLDSELDAILAVVIGGTSMAGGKFSILGTVIGSIIIRTIITFVYFFGIMPDASMAFRAAIVAVLIVLQSEPVRKWFAKRSALRAEAVRGQLHA